MRDIPRDLLYILCKGIQMRWPTGGWGVHTKRVSKVEAKLSHQRSVAQWDIWLSFGGPMRHAY